MYESNPDYFSDGFFCNGDDCSWNFDLDECQAKGKYSSIKNCKILPRLLGFELISITIIINTFRLKKLT